VWPEVGRLKLSGQTSGTYGPLSPLPNRLRQVVLGVHRDRYATSSTTRVYSPMEQTSPWESKLHKVNCTKTGFLRFTNHISLSLRVPGANLQSSVKVYLHLFMPWRHMGNRGIAPLIANQPRYKRVWFPMVPLEFFIDIILSAAVWLWGRLSLWQKWVSGIFLGGKGGRCVRLTTLPHSCTDCLETWKP